MIIHDFHFREYRRGIWRVPSELAMPNSFINQSTQRDLYTKTHIAMGLVSGGNSIWVFKDWCSS